MKVEKFPQWISFVKKMEEIETLILEKNQNKSEIRISNEVLVSLLSSVKSLADVCEKESLYLDDLSKNLKMILEKMFEKLLNNFSFEEIQDEKFKKISQIFEIINTYLKEIFIISKSLYYFDQKILWILLKTSIANISKEILKNKLFELKFFEDCIENLNEIFFKNEAQNTEFGKKENLKISCFFKTLNSLIVEPLSQVSILGEREIFSYKMEKSTKSENYLNFFENKIVSFKKKVYNDIFEKTMKNFGISEYLKTFEKFIEQEINISKELYPLSCEKVEAEIYELLISSKSVYFFENLRPNLFDILISKDHNTTKVFFRIFSQKEENIKVLSIFYRKFIEKKLNSLSFPDEKLDGGKGPIDFCKAFLEVVSYSNFECLNLFNNSTKIIDQRDSALINYCNEKQSIPKFLSFYIDFEMKVGMKNDDENIINQKIDLIIQIFRTFHSRDIFLNYHSLNFAKRLLKNMTINSEVEDKLISKLKIECGNSAVLKMERMKSDILDSNELSKEFHTSEFRKIQNIEFNVKILTISCWPEVFQKYSFSCIEPYSSILSEFASFYMNKYTETRNLVWVHSEGNVELIYNYQEKKYNLLCTILQANILIEIERKGSVPMGSFSFQSTEISSRLESELKELEESGIIEEKDDIFTLCNEFQSTNTKIDLLPKPKRPIPKLSKRTSRDLSIDKEREFTIDSIIVRVMKQEKKLSFQELEAKCVQETDLFVPQTQFIKQRVEFLIQRNYLERDENDQSLLIYLP